MLLLVGTAVGAYAQFEKSKWFVNPSVTGLNLSYSAQEKAHFGLQVQGGAFLVDNLALLLDIGGEYGKHSTDITSIGVGGRYYFSKCGLFLGLKLQAKHYAFDNGSKDNDCGIGAEFGYAFFLSRTVTIEPAVYYEQSFTNQDYSKVGFKIGFGFYF